MTGVQGLQQILQIRTILLADGSEWHLAAGHVQAPVFHTWASQSLWHLATIRLAQLATKGKLDSPQVAVCQSQVAQDCHLAPIGIMIPSGKHTKNDGKSPCLMGQSTINHQRVNRSIANFSHRTIRCQMVSTCKADTDDSTHHMSESQMSSSHSTNSLSLFLRMQSGQSASERKPSAIHE